MIRNSASLLPQIHVDPSFGVVKASPAATSILVSFPTYHGPSTKNGLVGICQELFFTRLGNWGNYKIKTKFREVQIGEHISWAHNFANGPELDIAFR